VKTKKPTSSPKIGSVTPKLAALNQASSVSRAPSRPEARIDARIANVTSHVIFTAGPNCPRARRRITCWRRPPSRRRGMSPRGSLGSPEGSSIGRPGLPPSSTGGGRNGDRRRRPAARPTNSTGSERTIAMPTPIAASTIEVCQRVA
jgi:hypothetical protein